VDVRTRRLIGWVVAVVGAAIAIVGALADQIGLGTEGVDECGSKQVAVVVVGVVLVVAGAGLALWRPKQPS
jgi:hypothetical protein